MNAAWAGLGFYRRARMLHKGAQVVAAAPYDGELPRSVGELKAIPGIGPYTAGAIASIAYGQPEALVDGNVRPFAHPRQSPRVRLARATPSRLRGPRCCGCSRACRPSPPHRCAAIHSPSQASACPRGRPGQGNRPYCNTLAWELAQARRHTP